MKSLAIFDTVCEVKNLLSILNRELWQKHSLKISSKSGA